MAEAADAISTAVDIVVDRVRAGGRLVYVGAGTSGRLVMLDAAELGPTYGVGPETVVARMAGGDWARMEPVEGAEDSEDAAEHDSADVGPDDVVVCLAASGRTPYVLAAARHARKAGATTGVRQPHGRLARHQREAAAAAHGSSQRSPAPILRVSRLRWPQPTGT